MVRELSFSSSNLGISRKFGKEVEEHFIQECGETIKKLDVFWAMNIQKKV